MNKLALTSLAVACLVAPSQAALIFVTDRATLDAETTTDLNWHNSQNVEFWFASHNVLGGIISANARPGGTTFARLFQDGPDNQDPTAWHGNFDPGSVVIAMDEIGFVEFVHGGALGFNSMSKWGTQVQTLRYGDFTASVRAFWQNPQDVRVYSDWFSLQGTSTDAADGSAIFLGFEATTRDDWFHGVQLYVRHHSEATSGNFAFNEVSVTAVPEPASLAALGLGLIAVARRRRSK